VLPAGVPGSFPRPCEPCGARERRSNVELFGVPVERADRRPRIVDAVVDTQLPGGRAHLAANPDQAVLHVYGLGVFLVERGDRVRFFAYDGASDDALTFWLESTVAMLLLAQRGQFALHGSVVEIAGSAVTVCGPRGAGKTTTALRLEQRGHTVVTDDVTVLSAGQGITAHSLAHPVRVLRESAVRLGLDVGAAERLADRPKLVIPSPPQRARAVTAIAELSAGGRGAVACERLRGARAHWAVERNAYRGGLFRPLWGAEMFAWAGRVSAALPVYAVIRPANGWTVDAVAEELERIAAGMG
jgi:HPr Serine kinase C-terminal domain